MSMAFAGYAALFDRVDRAGDVTRPGAFGGPATVPLLWQHRGRPVGHVTTQEDAHGLRVAGVIDDPEAARLVRSGAVAGLSVGYRPRRVHQGAHRELHRVDLVEVSLVAVPMQPRARVDRIDG
ncbi:MULTISPECIES: HK97 family phage prohead protease [unclassified Sphingomonas]|uniref:HK97 family phage prohead protease n=1 Tax=unclassified Sphingomonas TaxID=196159 RepID=UPI001F575555|nr:MULTISPECIES: HK97 family phage prohead protease [unclassified Sphingomonas]